MTEVDIWIPLASGVLGIVGALAGTAVTQRATRKREDRRWDREREMDQSRYERERIERQRERRTALYVDLAEYAQSEQSHLEVVIDEYGENRPKVPDLQHPDRLTARVKLYATAPVRESWDALVEAMEGVRWEWSEGDLNHGAHGDWLDHDNPSVLKLNKAIKEMQSVLRVAIEQES